MPLHLPISPHISPQGLHHAARPHPPISPHISPYLPISPHISPYLPLCLVGAQRAALAAALQQADGRGQGGLRQGRHLQGGGQGGQRGARAKDAQGGHLPRPDRRALSQSQEPGPRGASRGPEAAAAGLDGCAPLSSLRRSVHASPFRYLGLFEAPRDGPLSRVLVATILDECVLVMAELRPYAAHTAVSLLSETESVGLSFVCAVWWPR